MMAEDKHAAEVQAAVEAEAAEEAARNPEGADDDGNEEGEGEEGGGEEDTGFGGDLAEAAAEDEVMGADVFAAVCCCFSTVLLNSPSPNPVTLSHLLSDSTRPPKCGHPRSPV